VKKVRCNQERRQQTMKKFGLLLIGGIAAIVLLHNLAPMVGLVISLAILYFVVKQFLKTDSILMKIGWGTIGFFALMASASNIPAILGIAALYVLYLVFKKWNKTKNVIKEENDPFVNFEKQWSELNKY
jgi:lia operon protein LiaI